MTRTAGRRAAPRRRRTGFPVTVLLALVLPLATVGALAAVDRETVTVAPLAPDLQELDRADLGCPSAVAGAGVRVGSAVAAAGPVQLRPLDEVGAKPATVRLGAGAVAEDETGAGPVLVTGRDDLAPGLLGLRSGGPVLAASRCPAPQPETWFTGLGARAGHASVLELVNPDVGPAVVDVAVYAPAGLLDVPDLRGMRVPGRSALRVDLAQVAPRRGDLAIEVAVTRGRATATVLDRVGDFGAEEPVEDWIPGQAAPQPAVVLLGLPEGAGPRTLSVLNPGTDEARVGIKVISPESTFAPSGWEELQVAPGAVVQVGLEQLLAPEIRKGATGLLVTASRPVVAGLASLVDGDLAVAGDGGPITSSAAALLPDGEARLLLAGATRTGVVTVVSRDADGTQLESRRLELARGRSQQLDLPRGTAWVQVEPSRTPVVGSVLVRGRGATVVPLLEVERYGYIPGVRPALP